MKVIINGYNLKLGGGLRVALGIIDSILHLKLEEDEIHIFLPKQKIYSFSSKEANIHFHFIPRFYTDFSIGRLLVRIYLSHKVNRLKPDRVFSLGNYALSVKALQLLLIQWPYAVYPDSIVWRQMKIVGFLKRKFRLYFLKKTLKYTNAMTVQTKLMKDRVRKYLPHFNGDIFVVESSCKLKHDKLDSLIFSFKKERDEKLLLCMSEYYSHKNLEMLIPLACLIRKSNLKYKIIVTLSPDSLSSLKLLLKIRYYDLDKVIMNIGRVEPSQTSSIYRQCDALILPTLLESFGIPYIEAAYAKLPVITSDLDFAHEMNGENAWYFNPLSSESILATVQEAFSDPILMKEKVDRAFLKVSKMKSWEEITKEYLEIIRNLN